MQPKKQTLESRRRKPRQARARHKVDAIFEATIQVLQREGRSAVNTNRIAERAGVSVSTLYEYFENKEEILLALARKELGLHRESMRELMSAPVEAELDLDRRVIRAVIAATSGRNRLRHMALEILVAQGMSDELAAPAKDVERFLAANRQKFLPNSTQPLSPVALFVLTRALQGAIYAGLREDSPFLHSPEFETELIRLVRGYAALLEDDAECVKTGKLKELELGCDAAHQG